MLSLKVYTENNIHQWRLGHPKGDMTLSIVIVSSNTQLIYNNNYSSIIDIDFYETFSTLSQTFSAHAQLFRHPV
jgi:hypothetical protein